METPILQNIPPQSDNQNITDQEFKVHKPWYKRPVRTILMIIVLLIISFALFFVWKVFYYASAIKRGDFSVFNGDIVDIRQLSTPGQVNRSQLETPDDPYSGPLDAKVTVVEFGDYSCPFTKQDFPIVNKIRDMYKDRVKFIYRDFPITAIHPYSLIASEASECAHEQGGFWLYHDLLFARQDQFTTKEELIGYADEIGLSHDKFAACLNSDNYQTENLSDLQDGIALGITGTPTFFFNGQKVAGVLGEETFKQILDSMLAKNQ